jgi:hypothetical protein
MGMSTTQAFRNALHIPLSDPTVGQVVTTMVPAGDLYPTYWALGAAATSTPPATAEFQFLTSGPSPGFAWTVVDTIDCGEM